MPDYPNGPPVEVLPQLTLGARRGKRSKEELLVMVDRPLTPGDLAALDAQEGTAQDGPVLQKLRSTHHQVAQLLAQGFPQVEVSRITGYSQSRLSVLKTDPAFAELVASYQGIKEFKFADAMERMNALGMHAIEELQERLDTAPEEFDTRTVMELVEMTMIKSKAASRGGPHLAMAPTSVVQVQFISPGGKVIDAEVAPATTLEGRATRLIPEDRGD